jgi:hypothetical protein
MAESDRISWDVVSGVALVWVVAAVAWVLT